MFPLNSAKLLWCKGLINIIPFLDIYREGYNIYIQFVLPQLALGENL